MVKKIFYYFSFLLITNIMLGQNVLLSPAKGYFLDNPGLLKYKLMFAPSDSLILDWQPSLSAGAGAKLKIGVLPGIYDAGEFDVSGTRMGAILEENPLSLSTGRYYAVITNSTHDTYEEITADYQNNPGTIVFSTEIQFIVEAQTAPTALGPTGIIDDATPIFEWTNVPGVPTYFLIVSSTPFTVVTLPNGEITVEGANIVWEYITDETSILYGDVDPNAPYNIQPPPLLPGTEYNYTVINMYDPADITFASSVFGGVESFTYQAEQTIDPPELIAPADNATFYGDEYITFQWEEVENVNSYTIYLYQRLTSFAGNDQQIDIPLWNSTTTNTSIEYPARTTLSKGTYIWNVIPNDDEGAGVISETNEFEYILQVGSFRVSAYSSTDNSALLNFEFNVESVEGGVTPPNNYVVTNSQTYTDSLVVGTYQFTGSKTGYFDSTFTVVISEDTPFKSINLFLRPFPSVISGTVIDQDGSPVSNGTVKFTNVLTSEGSTVSTDLDGTFSAILPRATYSITAYKQGYLAADQIYITADQEHINLTEAITIVEDNAFISGKVLNDLGAPVKQVLVKAVNGPVTQQASTNVNGNYSFQITSGNWTISAAKNGFISPAPDEYTLNAGDNLQNQNIILVPRANQVTGFVERITSVGGTTPFSGVTVTATPSSGTPVTAVTTSSGEFQLSLRAGTYILTAAKTGYSNTQQINLTLTVAQTISGINFTMVPNPSSISGLVTTPDGNGLGGVTVASSSGATATTLPNGTYTLSVNNGTHILSVTKSGYVPPNSKTVTVTPGQNLTGVNFSMTPNAGSITGTVSGLQQSLANATVKATGTETYQVQTAANGAYSLSLKPGTYNVVASKNGFETSTAKQITIGPGQISPNNNFNLVEKIATIQGIVKNSNGTPLSNAQIAISDNATETITTVTNINGNYAMSVEAGASYTITVNKTGYGEYSMQTSELASGSTVNINATLTANPSSITGYVKDNNQAALASIEIKVYNATSGAYIKTLVTQANGKYSSGFTAGSYKLVASEPGYLADSTTITLALGQNPTNINFTLSENFALITGSVKGINDDGLAGAEVNLSGENGGGSAITDDGGNYTLSGLIGGTYTLNVALDQHSDSVITNYTIRDGESKVVNFVLYSLDGKISGTVKDADANLIGSATVTLTNTVTSEQKTTLSTTDGTYEFAGIEFGTYELGAIKSGYIESSQFTATITQATPEVTVSINDLVAKNSSITGIVKDDSGLLIAEADISIYSDAGSGGAVSDNQGSFEVTSLAPGTYQLIAQKQGYATVDTTFDVESMVALELVLNKNRSSVNGKVADQNGSSVGFQVQVNLVAANNNFYSATTDVNGNFEIDGVSDDTEYQLYSVIFREGYVNDTASVSIPFNTESVTQNLAVTLNLSKISGNTDIGSANVTLLNTGTGKSTSLQSSGSGSYSFGYLAAGNYEVTASKEGYSFSPDKNTATVTFKDTITDKNFIATQNNGTITVNTKSNGNALESVLVSVVGTSNDIVKSGNTNGLGTISFANVPAGDYVVSASKDLYSATPESETVTLQNSGDLTLNFDLNKDVGELSGLVFRYNETVQVPLPNTTVKIKYTATGETFTTTTNSSGRYLFENLSTGEITLNAIKTGFTSEELQFVVGAVPTERNIELTALVASIIGYVRFEGNPVEGVPVTATSTSTISTTTNATGQFSFNSLPVKAGANDTTYYIVSLASSELPAYSHVVTLTSASIGATTTIPDFNLPSGQVKLTISDGTNPLPGVKISFTEPDGNSSSTVTGNPGTFDTENNLTKGTYRLTIEKAGYLTPDEQDTRITLETDTTKVDTTFLMSYQFEELDSVFANEATIVKITSLTSTANTEATLYYKKQSANEFTEVPMTVSSNKFTGLIPPLYSLEKITYYVQLSNNSTGVEYSSDEYTIEPLASGILSSLNVSPSVNGLTLRSGDSYNISLVIRDGLGKNLIDEFTGDAHEGSVTWDISKAEGIDIEYPNSSDSTDVTILVNTAGQYEIKVTTQLKSSVQTKTLRFDVTDIPLKKIVISSPVTRMSNKANGVQISYSGVDTLNRPIYMGNEVEWTLTPEYAGTITEIGFYTPLDSSYIGNPVITVNDKLTNIQQTISVNVFAEIKPGNSYRLTDNDGMVLNLPSNATFTPIEISLDQAQFGPAKKQFTPIGGRQTFTSSSKLYNFQYRAGVALSGDSLKAGGTLLIPDVEDLEFFDGGKYIGFYNKSSKIWALMNSDRDASGNYTTNAFTKFGEYSLLTENEELGIKHAAVLPSPFSPKVAPLKIGYFLSTAERMAQVTIEVYNIKGQLVRTILDNDAQVSGKYGTRTGQKEITWDGLTDSGREARNGRYIIKIKAKDSTGEKSELVQVVLIK